MEKDFSSLASKVLSGEATEQERATLRQMLHESEQDTLLFNEMNDFINFLWRAAAIFLLLLSCGVIYYYNAYPSHTYMYATQGAISDYILRDGTKVKLNKNSSITFTSSFRKKNRVIDLTGEAYFEVTKDAAKKFIVRTQGGGDLTKTNRWKCVWILCFRCQLCHGRQSYYGSIRKSACKP
jgi:hypothetical protein